MIINDIVDKIRDNIYLKTFAALENETNIKPKINLVISHITTQPGLSEPFLTTTLGESDIVAKFITSHKMHIDIDIEIQTDDINITD